MAEIFLNGYLFKSKRVISDAQFDRLITSKEFAKQQHIEVRTALKWAVIGKVWATKIGHHWYFDPLCVLTEK